MGSLRELLMGGAWKCGVDSGTVATFLRLVATFMISRLDDDSTLLSVAFSLSGDSSRLDFPVQTGFFRFDGDFSTSFLLGGNFSRLDFVCWNKSCVGHRNVRIWHSFFVVGQELCEFSPDQKASPYLGMFITASSF